ncbi:MAG: alpha/beta hydrolase [Oscillospiraceae bacterium]|nr:alpha/beta hydrolase [Oscillospiraceae bacterium]
MFIDINDIRINYTGEGEENLPVLLLLHGWGCHGEVYRSIINRLNSRFRVIVPDLPGFGKSAEPPDFWNVSDYAGFIAEFCRILNINPAVIFAHSLGARIAIKMLSSPDYAINPQKVIFTGAAGIKPKKTFSQKVKITAYKTGKFFLKPFPKQLIKLQSKSGSADYRAASLVMRGCLVKIVNEDLTPLLPLINNDVLLIWGENDDSTPLSDGRLMEKAMPNAGLAVIQNAGHYAFSDQPEIFGKILDSYLY